MPAALPFIGAGLGIYSSIKGAQQQGKANRLTEQQLAQQNQIRQLVLGRLMGGPQGAVGNPFSVAYGAPAAGATAASAVPNVANAPPVAANSPMGTVYPTYGKLYRPQQ